MKVVMSSMIRVLLLVVATMVVVAPPKATEAAAPRAFFVFGDSLVDSGNNNYLETPARADSAPYGIDYPTHLATGRFSNGFNFPDIICQRIGSEPPLPYLSPELQGEKLLVGANFASAGIGILNDTGIQFVEIIRMFQQFAYFEQYQQRLIALVGADQAQEIVNGGLYLMTLGGNDFVNNYFLTPPITLRSHQFTVPQFSQFIISEYRKILMRLYELGACRVLVTGSGPLGCVPSQLAARSTNGDCVPELQEATEIYNPLLKQMTRDLNSQLGSDVFIAVNTNKVHTSFITNPEAFGFETSKIACCGQGPYNGLGQCTALSLVCTNRDVYAFWDAFHPSQRALEFIAEGVFSGGSDIISPMNLSTIMVLDSKSKV